MRVLIIILSLSLTLLGCGKQLLEESKANLELELLEKKSQWFITKGIAEYYSTKNIEQIEKKIKDTYIWLYTGIQIEENGYLAD